MPKRRTSSVTVYHGKRGKTFGIRYSDADGRRVSETLGSELDGWTEKRAEEELEERRVQVRKEGRRKLEPVTFATFAREWLATYPDKKDLKRSTREGYESIVEGHLIPELGGLRLAAVDTERLERYVGRKQRAGLAGRTVNRHLNLLHSVFKAAEKRGLVRGNPAPAVDRPGEPRRSSRRWRSAEWSGGSSSSSTRRRARSGPGASRRASSSLPSSWPVSAAGRSSAYLASRCANGPGGRALLRVEETFVRGQADTPKSEKSERTIALGQRLASELFDHRARTAFIGDDERVFCSQTGGPLDPVRYAKALRAALGRAKGRPADAAVPRRAAHVDH
jgi:Phage integrase, N-terminal SAM-like domain